MVNENEGGRDVRWLVERVYMWVQGWMIGGATSCERETAHHTACYRCPCDLTYYPLECRTVRQCLTMSDRLTGCARVLMDTPL